MNDALETIGAAMAGQDARRSLDLGDGAWRIVSIKTPEDGDGILVEIHKRLAGWRSSDGAIQTARGTTTCVHLTRNDIRLLKGALAIVGG